MSYLVAGATVGAAGDSFGGLGARIRGVYGKLAVEGLGSVDETVRAVQEALNAYGASPPLEMDGVLKQAVADAIRDFWGKKGLSHEALIDADLLRELGVTAANTALVTDFGAGRAATPGGSGVAVAGISKTAGAALAAAGLGLGVFWYLGRKSRRAR